MQNDTPETNQVRIRIRKAIRCVAQPGSNIYFEVWRLQDSAVFN